jgi:hypothetical protein
MPLALEEKPVFLSKYSGSLEVGQRGVEVLPDRFQIDVERKARFSTHQGLA